MNDYNELATIVVALILLCVVWISRIKRNFAFATSPEAISGYRKITIGQLTARWAGITTLLLTASYIFPDTLWQRRFSYAALFFTIFVFILVLKKLWDSRQT